MMKLFPENFFFQKIKAIRFPFETKAFRDPRNNAMTQVV